MTRPQIVKVRGILSREEENQITAVILQERVLDIGGSICEMESDSDADWDTIDHLRKKAIILRLARRILLREDPIDLDGLDLDRGLDEESRK